MRWRQLPALEHVLCSTYSRLGYTHTHKDVCNPSGALPRATPGDSSANNPTSLAKHSPQTKTNHKQNPTRAKQPRKVGNCKADLYNGQPGARGFCSFAPGPRHLEVAKTQPACGWGGCRDGPVTRFEGPTAPGAGSPGCHQGASAPRCAAPTPAGLGLGVGRGASAAAGRPEKSQVWHARSATPGSPWVPSGRASPQPTGSLALARSLVRGRVLRWVSKQAPQPPGPQGVHGGGWEGALGAEWLL